MVPEFAIEKLRQITVFPYRVVYEIDDEAMLVAVLRIWHGARDHPDESDLKPGTQRT